MDVANVPLINALSGMRVRDARRITDMTIERIFVATEKGGEQVDVDAARVVVRLGIEGDRNFGKTRNPGQNVTFVAAEEIERFSRESGLSIGPSATRRNIVTRGVRLDALVGREFSIGAASSCASPVRCLGRVCEPTRSGPPASSSCSRIAPDCEPTFWRPARYESATRSKSPSSKLAGPCSSYICGERPQC
jgi:hypothetical protein